MIKVGFGYDFHRMKKGRKCILGGVRIPFEKGPLGHSDADVLIHAICDGILGAAGLGDIGGHFPDNDVKYKNISSLVLLDKVKNLILKKKFKIIHIDTVLILEKPKITAYKNDMKAVIAKTLKIPKTSVNIKATTTEGLTPHAKSNAVSAYAVVTLKGSSLK